MGQNIRLHWAVSRVWAPTLDLLEDEERRCLDLSVLQCSILRQMTFPWARAASRLVEDHGDYQTIVDQPVAYQEALDELEVLLSGAYDGPVGGCPVGEIFVDRGNPDTRDFYIGSGLTADGIYRTLDLSAKVTDSDANRVLLLIQAKDGSTGQNFAVRQYGDSGANAAAWLRTQAANVAIFGQISVYMPVLRQVEYIITSGMDVAEMTVQGWWKPG